MVSKQADHDLCFTVIMIILSDICYNLWLFEPSLDLQDELKCNIHDQVQLRCRLGSVARGSGISVAWMYSESESIAGTGGSEVSSGVHIGIVNETTATILSIATLTLSTTLEPGYYWCAATNVTMDFVANPSTILYYDPSCVSDYDTNCTAGVYTTSSTRCAIGDREDTLMIGDLQNPDLCREATTSKPSK